MSVYGTYYLTKRARSAIARERARGHKSQYHIILLSMMQWCLWSNWVAVYSSKLAF